MIQGWFCEEILGGCHSLGLKDLWYAKEWLLKSWGEKCWETERNKDILLFSEKQTIGKKTCLFGMELDPWGWAHGDKGVRKLEEIETSKSLKEEKKELNLSFWFLASVYVYIKKNDIPV